MPRSLQKQGELTLGYQGEPGEGRCVLEIATEALDWPETREFTELLNLAPDRARPRRVAKSRNTMFLQAIAGTRLSLEISLARNAGGRG
jgi:hypothetical protein